MVEINIDALNGLANKIDSLELTDSERAVFDQFWLVWLRARPTLKGSRSTRAATRVSWTGTRTPPYPREIYT